MVSAEFSRSTHMKSRVRINVVVLHFIGVANVGARKESGHHFYVEKNLTLLKW